jgi:hypothetical protein
MPPPEHVSPFAQTIHHYVCPAIPLDEALDNSAIGLTIVVTGAGRGIGRA